MLVEIILQIKKKTTGILLSHLINFSTIYKIYKKISTCTFY